MRRIFPGRIAMSPSGPKGRHRAQNPGASPLGVVRHQPVISPMADLMTDLDRVRYSGCLPPDWDERRLAVWQDDHDVYIEAELPAAFSNGELDISIISGKIFVRMGR